MHKNSPLIFALWTSLLLVGCDREHVEPNVSDDMDMAHADLARDLSHDTSVPDLTAPVIEDAQPDLMVEEMGVDMPSSTRAFLDRARLLQGHESHDNRVAPMQAFAPDPDAQIDEAAVFSATVRLTPAAHSIGIWRDDGARGDLPQISRPPTIQVGLVRRAEDGALVPVEAGFVGQSESWWAMVGTGSTWREPGDGGSSRAALPFTLVEPFANCSFHGVMTWLYDAQSAAMSDAYYQITQETCLYFKADLWGWFEVSAEELDETLATSTLSRFGDELRARLPVRPLDELEGVDLDAFFTGRNTQHVTTHGVIFEGEHYSARCATRQGDNPWCGAIALPSYSTAKSAVAGLSYLAMRRTRPWLGESTLGEFMDVPESWRDVTLDELLDMRSGHYDSALYMADEDGLRQFDFFLAHADDDKFQVALSYPPQPAPSPAPWVYHTSDTFLAARQMQHVLGQDLFDWLVEHVYAPLGTSATSRTAHLRTLEAQGWTQHFGGYGSFWLPGDVALLGESLHAHARGERDDLFEAQELERVMQAGDMAAGINISPGLWYGKGFWGLEVDESMGFECRRVIPFMSGFGGITVAMLPNGVTYYVFRDDGEFDWLGAARELSRLGDFCAW